MRKLLTILGFAAATATATLAVCWPCRTYADPPETFFQSGDVDDITFSGEVARDPALKSGWALKVTYENRGDEDETCQLDSELMRAQVNPGSRASPAGTAVWHHKDKVTVAAHESVVKSYEALNIAYSESKDREIECLEIIQRAWQEDNFSYKGKFYNIQDVTVVPHPVQQPTPEIRLAAVSVETFPTAGKAGQGLFLSARHEDVRMHKPHIDVYRKAWTDAGHPGEAPVYLRCPGFVAKTDAAAEEAYGPTLMQHFQNQNRLLSDSARRQNSPPDHPRWKTAQRLTEITFEEVLRGSVFIGSPDTVVGKLKDLQRDIGLSGVQLETNCAGLADHAAEREAIRLLAQEVKSAFR